MTDVVASRFVVRGRVQGVGFRAATRAEASALSIDGHAANQADGSVEVIASGAPERVERLASWLSLGPAHARVESVERGSTEQDVKPGFRIG